LGLFATAGVTALIAGCCSGSDDSSSSGTTTTTSTSTGTTTTSGSTTPTSTSTSSDTCIADPAETSGPIPTTAPTAQSDIRSSFISSTTVAAGVLLTITLTVVNVNNSCAALSGYAVYLWHCDEDGNYSLYSAPTESYLRGVQVTAANGQVTFTTIFPGCYSGRYPHMHFEVFSSLSSATTGRNAVLTSQLAMPRDICTTVYAAGGYSGSTANLAQVTTSSDNVFGDNTTAQIAAMTPSLTGSVSADYAATVTIGLSL
jgi:protocatechuate 3,4-dioxygenase beta subunit